MKVYYAHCIAIYNTPQEHRDLVTLAEMGFEVANPNSKESSEGYKLEGMDYFKKFSLTCDAVVFRAMPDGRIPAGVATEVEWFREAGKPVLELPSAIIRRKLTVDETRQALLESGTR